MKTRFLLSLCLLFLLSGTTYGQDNKEEQVKAIVESGRFVILFDRANPCLLYTSDAADDLLCVDLGGRRTI